MSGMLSDEELAALTPSEMVGINTPIPTQIVSSDEFYPGSAEREADARSRRGCSRWPTSSAASRASTAAGSSRPRPAWPRRSSR